MNDVLITFKRMNCNGCVRNITKALQTIPGVEIVRSDIPTKTMQVRYEDGEVTLEHIQEVVAEAGYPAVSMCSALDENKEELVATQI